MEIQIKWKKMHLVGKNSTILGRNDYAFNFKYRLSNVHTCTVTLTLLGNANLLVFSSRRGGSTYCGRDVWWMYFDCSRAPSARKISWRGKLIDSSSGINSCRTGRGWTQPIISLHSLKHLLIWRFSHLEPLANRRFQIDSAHPGRKAWSPLQEGPGPALRPWMLQWGSWCSLVQIFVSQIITPCNFFNVPPPILRYMFVFPISWYKKGLWCTKIISF